METLVPPEQYADDWLQDCNYGETEQFVQDKKVYFQRLTLELWKDDQCILSSRFLSEKKHTLLPMRQCAYWEDTKKHVYTITTDNGLEFAQHQQVAKKLKCDYYFCHPYSSWERGLNENINGLIRQYIPKGSSFEHLSAQEIKHIENRLNHRPRKSLGWKTPYEVFHENLNVSQEDLDRIFLEVKLHFGFKFGKHWREIFDPTAQIFLN